MGKQMIWKTLLFCKLYIPFFNTSRPHQIEKREPFVGGNKLRKSLLTHEKQQLMIQNATFCITKPIKTQQHLPHIIL